MTEQEWLQENDPHPLLEYLRGKASERKLRLFACACCRRIWHRLKDDRSKEAIELVERYADGQIERERMKAAEWAALAAEKVEWSKAAEAAALAATTALGEYHLLLRPSLSLQPIAADRLWVDYARVVATLAASACGVDKDRVELNRQRSLVHDLFGNPFCSAEIDPSWLGWHDSTIPRLAQAFYDERAFDRLPILADALEEAGCTNADILDHCRMPAEHIRGCWVVDLLLGKH